MHGGSHPRGSPTEDSYVLNRYISSLPRVISENIGILRCRSPHANANAQKETPRTPRNPEPAYGVPLAGARGLGQIAPLPDAAAIADTRQPCCCSRSRSVCTLALRSTAAPPQAGVRVNLAKAFRREDHRVSLVRPLKLTFCLAYRSRRCSCFGSPSSFLCSRACAAHASSWP